MLITVSLNSTAIKQAQYNSAACELDITYVREGRRYRYYQVDPTVFAELQTAPSAGAYLNKHIRGQHLEVRVE